MNLKLKMPNQRQFVLAGGVAGLVVLLVLTSGGSKGFGPAGSAGPTDSAATDAAREAGLPDLGDSPFSAKAPTATPGPQDAAQPAAGFDSTFKGAVGAFDCGSGGYIGAIEPGRSFSKVPWADGEPAPLGYLKLNVDGSGEVCVRIEELVQ